MYEKMLMRHEILYFRHAPPQTELDDEFIKRSKRPYVDAPKDEQSVFYYWWAFLRENENYLQCCEEQGSGDLAALYHFFGDVRPVSFMNWWKFGGNATYRGRDLFCEPLQTIKVGSINWTPTAEETVIRLNVPVVDDLTRLKKEFMRILQPAIEASRMHQSDQTIPAAGSALFPVAIGNPKLSAIHEIFQVISKKRANLSLTDHQIAIEMGMQGSRNDLEKKISRLRGRGKKLVKNVEFGRFPDFGNYENCEPALPRALELKKRKEVEIS